MSKFKVGDKFKLISNRMGFPANSILFLKRIESDGCHLFECENKETIYLFSDRVALIECEDESNLYKKSNRYKLSQAIKKTGFSSRGLSRIASNSDSYFYNLTGEARFNKRGDISDSNLSNALTNLALAERELLGVGAKETKEVVNLNPNKYLKQWMNEMERKQNHNIEFLSTTRPTPKITKYSISKKSFWSIIFILVLMFIFIITGFVKQIF